MPIRSRFTRLACLLGLGWLAPCPATAATGPVVTVATGQLAGDTTADGRVRRFLGVPYAAAPTGPRRWRAPEPAPHWSGVRQATAFGPRCMQRALFADMVFRSPGPSEDCLYLNVWAPAAPASAKRPVLVYLYGGGFQAGDGSEPRYDGESMARRGIVVVTLNYRLGAFGFLAHPELTRESPHRASGNYGLLDQAAALDWVRRNIARFGGDPAQITMGGESAGSMSVSAMMASRLTRGHFARAIGESGAMMAPTQGLPPRSTAEATGLAAASAAGVADLAGLRALSAAQVLALPTTLHFGPAVDGWYLREDVTQTFASGRQARIPLLVGTNTQEAPAAAVLGDAPPTLDAWHAALVRLFGPQANAVAKLYPAATDADVLPAATALASDRFLAHATWAWFDAQRRIGEPVYLYHFAHVRPPALADPAAPQPYGAVHSADIEYALGNLHTHDAYAWTADDDRVSATFEGYLADFVLTGDPNGPGLPAWPRASADAGAIARERIDVTTEAVPFPEQARYVAMTGLLTAR